jgi:hypothetical protein
MFSSPFHPKIFGFWSIILQNRTKHHAKFLAKRYPFSVLDFGLKRSKKPKSQKVLTHLMKNLAFWMELNTHMKILVFCILSFQSSCYFAFCIPWGTKHNLSRISHRFSATVPHDRTGNERVLQLEKGKKPKVRQFIFFFTLEAIFHE